MVFCFFRGRAERDVVMLLLPGFAPQSNNAPAQNLMGAAMSVRGKWTRLYDVTIARISTTLEQRPTPKLMGFIKEPWAMLEPDLADMNTASLLLTLTHPRGLWRATLYFLVSLLWEQTRRISVIKRSVMFLVVQG